MNIEKGTGTSKKLAEHWACQKVLDIVLIREKTEQTIVSQLATEIILDFNLDPEELVTKATYSDNAVRELNEFCQKNKISDLKYEEAC